MCINVKTKPANAIKPKELRANKRNLFTPKKFNLLFLIIKGRTNAAGKLLKKTTSIKGKSQRQIVRPMTKTEEQLPSISILCNKKSKAYRRQRKLKLRGMNR